MTMSISSTAFSHGSAIPSQYTEDGANVSPPLTWEGVPAAAKELALICDDPDAPRAEPWVHWVLYKIPAHVNALPEQIPGDIRLQSPIRACQGRNSWSSGRIVGYRGPAPPRGHGTHHYHFKLFALNREVALEPGIDKATLLDAIAEHVLAEAELIGTYER